MSRRSYDRVKDKSVVKVEGSTEDSLVAKGHSLNRAKNVRTRTSRFMSRPDRVVNGPILANPVLPNQIKEELNVLGYDIRINRRGIHTANIRMKENHLSGEVLAANGIVINKQIDIESNQEYWHVSAYDMLHLLRHHYQDIQLHNEMLFWLNSENPNFMEDYIIFEELHRHGLVVMDSTQLMGNFAIYEEPSNEMLNEINKLPTRDIGQGKAISPHGIGFVHVIRRDEPSRLDTIISGVHTADKEDTRYFVATVDGLRDADGHLIIQDGPVKIYEIRHNKLNLAGSPGKKALIMYPDDEPIEEFNDQEVRHQLSNLLKGGESVD